MSGKVIDLDPNKRLTKESFALIQKTVAEFTHDDLSSIVIVYTTKEGSTSLEGFGVDWAMLGVCQAYLEELRNQALHGDDVDEYEDS